MNALDLGSLRAFANCKDASGCRIPPPQMLSVFGAALEHPQLEAGNKAALLSALGVYLANSLGDARASVASLRDAVALAPQNPELRLNLAQALLFLPDYDAAEAELAVAEKFDRWRVNAPTLARVRADLAGMRAAHKAAAPPKAAP
jgi:tetratricopeptide (TPR) repeat protein